MSENNNIDDNDLKQLREEKGLSLSEVSDQLKLSRDVITKIEQSQFKDLGAYTYVRGYLNHYAKLLNVDAQKYIDLIPKSDIEVALVNTSSQQNKTIKFKRQSTNMVNYFMGTFVVVAISFSAWFLLKNYSDMPKKSNTTIEIAQPTDIKNQAELESQMDSDQNQQNTNEEAYHYSSLIPSDDQQQNDTTDTKKDENALLIPEKQSVSEVNTRAEESTTNNAYTYEIKVIASETSWVKIEKLDGTKLHNDLLKPGEVLLHSNEPVHFRIGNQSKINVSINGKEINLTPYTRKNIADFNWPKES